MNFSTRWNIVGGIYTLSASWNLWLFKTKCFLFWYHREHFSIDLKLFFCMKVQIISNCLLFAYLKALPQIHLSEKRDKYWSYQYFSIHSVKTKYCQVFYIWTCVMFSHHEEMSSMRIKYCIVYGNSCKLYAVIR